MQNELRNQIDNDDEDDVGIATETRRTEESEKKNALLNKQQMGGTK